MTICDHAFMIKLAYSQNGCEFFESRICFCEMNVFCLIWMAELNDLYQGYMQIYCIYLSDLVA